MIQLARKMTKVGIKQIDAEKRRLIEARNIADSEKRLYVKVIPLPFFFLFSFFYVKGTFFLSVC